MSEIVFTAEQLQAIDVNRRQEDACITAGPGSGKTTVLVEYFQKLVEAGANPQRILAITFTEKAAANMRRKLAEAFAADSILRAKMERAWVSTVHGFCARLLKENSIFAGVDPDFRIADERQSWRWQQESIGAAVSELFDEQPAAIRALIRGLASLDFEEALLSAYDAMRGAGMSIDEVAGVPEPAMTSREELRRSLAQLRADPLSGWKPVQKQHMAEIRESLERIVSAGSDRRALDALEKFSANLPKCGASAKELVRAVRDRQLKEYRYYLVTRLYESERATLFDILRRFDRIYRDKKTAAGALDFADLEEYTVRLLESDAERRRQTREQFEYILMDEFQDTNGQQARFLELVRRDDRFYAVGDINQSIFGFRHAEPEVFRDYRAGVEKRGRRMVDLTGNFRSRADILRAVDRIAGSAEGVEPRALVAERSFAEPRDICVELLGALGEDSDQALHDEGRRVASRILELLESRNPPFHFKDVAVLLRNTEVIKEFTDAFDEAGIPYVVNRGKGFFESREVRDLYHLLRVIANPRDEVSLAAVLRSPLAQVSDEALFALRLLGQNIGESLLHLGEPAPAELSGADYETLIRLRDNLRRWRPRRESVTFDRLLLDAIDECGYPWSPNVEKFLAQARDASASTSLDEFVEQVELLRDDNVREPDAPPEDATDAVNVMTVHSAKGLEFPIVFVAALQKGVENKTPIIGFSKTYGLGARWKNPFTGDDKSDAFWHRIDEERKVREAQESNRLLYVAMTRAEEHLVLSYSGGPRYWAKEIAERLGIDPKEPLDDTLAMDSAGGEWNLRVLITAETPQLRRAEAPAGTMAENAFIVMPEITGQHDSNATVTALTAFARCPRQYYLGTYLGFEGRPRKLEDRKAASAGEFGSAVHGLLAGNPVAAADSEAERLAQVFRQSALGKRTARASHCEREFDFVMAVDGLVLRGQVDLWFEEAGELVIVDYKTDDVTPMEAHQRAKDYAMQLRLYALAIERHTGRAPGRAWLHFLRPNTAIEVDLTPSLLDSPEQLVREFLEAQRTLDFPINEGEQCRRCPFLGGLCPARPPNGRR